jgi:hypothetical protein
MYRLTLLKPLILLLVLCQNSRANTAIELGIPGPDFHSTSNIFPKIGFDSLAQRKRLSLESEFTKEPIIGAVLKLSDPLRHGVVFSYESDSLGQFQFDIHNGQNYYFHIQKDGFEAIEMKMASTELVTKLPIFTATNNQLLQIVSFEYFLPIETYLCWLYPKELDKTQIVGISHIIYTPFKVLPFLSF